MCVGAATISLSRPSPVLGLFDPDLAIGYLLAIETLHRRLGLTLPGHLDKTKALGFAARLVHYQGTGLHRAVGLEHGAKFRLGGGAGEITYQEFHGITVLGMNCLDYNACRG